MFHVPLRAAQLPVFTSTFLRMLGCPLFSIEEQCLIIFRLFPDIVCEALDQFLRIPKAMLLQGANDWQEF
jgi:hypothetical protein